MTFVKRSYANVTLYALAAVVESQFIKASDTGGYAAATAVTCTGMVAMESVSSGYFTASLEGIMAVCFSAAINPGAPVKWSDTDTVAPADCAQNYIGFALEGSGDSVSTRDRLIWYGPGGHLGVAQF